MGQKVIFEGSNTKTKSMIVCQCKAVSDKELVKFIKQFPNATFAEVRQSTGASTGCGRCGLSVQVIMENVNELRPKEHQLKLSFE
jgi:bacterioferritin-associated ferredoxin